ncbi:MAG: CoA protein activase, partial [Syntrophomonadaceae bacterium]|nr:CoA protein activase [Syntrophomonadaceae bacterium]
MKVTFPHMGNTHIAIKALLKGLKLEVIPPPPVTNRTLELGIKYSPEFACLPLKINIGNFIEAIENGADTIIMAGGWGPCRFGYYAQVQRDILYDLGYEFKMYILEAPDFKITELFTQLKGLAENVSFLEAIKAVRFAWYKINAVETLEKKFEYILPRSIDKDQVERLYKEALEAVDRADDRKTVDIAVKTYVDKMDRCPLGNHEILKIGLIGEIYTILEPSSNYNIIQQLGRLNAEVTRSVYTSDWINDHLLKGIVKKSNRKEIISCASPYLNYWVGGH